eukprot:4428161-Alexandrium_andersonii.AAC.1
MAAATSSTRGDRAATTGLRNQPRPVADPPLSPAAAATAGSSRPPPAAPPFHAGATERGPAVAPMTDRERFDAA